MNRKEKKEENYFVLCYVANGSSNKVFFIINQDGERASDNKTDLEALLACCEIFHVPRDRISDAIPEETILKIKANYPNQFTIEPVKLSSYNK